MGLSAAEDGPRGPCAGALRSLILGKARRKLPPMIEHDIRLLLDAPISGDGAPSVAAIEDTLTAGYARALALEAERRRLERRVAEIASGAHKEEVELHSELRTLARRMEGATADLANLRALLTLLRERAAKARAAAAA